MSIHNEQKSTAIGIITFGAMAAVLSLVFWLGTGGTAGLILAGFGLLFGFLGFLFLPRHLKSPETAKFVWNEDAPWLGGALLGLVVGSVLSVLIVKSGTNWLFVLLPASSGLLMIAAGLYVVSRHVRARWCFRCNRPRERWNYYWYYCTICREGRWYEDPDPDDSDVDYRRVTKMD